MFGAAIGAKPVAFLALAYRPKGIRTKVLGLPRHVRAKRLDELTSLSATLSGLLDGEVGSCA
jgi:hypothetical protein